MASTPSPLPPIDIDIDNPQLPEDMPSFPEDDTKIIYQYRDGSGFSVEDGYDQYIDCDVDLEERFPSPEWEETQLSRKYQGTIYTNIDLVPYEGESGVCSLTYSRQDVDIIFKQISKVPTAQDEGQECDCYERSYWKQTKNEVSEPETYTTSYVNHYYNNTYQQPTIFVGNDICTSNHGKTLTRDGWKYLSLTPIYGTGPYFTHILTEVTEVYVNQEWECTICEDEDEPFPDKVDGYYYSEPWTQEDIDNGIPLPDSCKYENATQEEAYITCVQMFRCKYIPDGEPVPPEPNPLPPPTDMYELQLSGKGICTSPLDIITSFKVVTSNVKEYTFSISSSREANSAGYYLSGVYSVFVNSQPMGSFYSTPPSGSFTYTFDKARTKGTVQVLVTYTESPFDLDHARVPDLVTTVTDEIACPYTLMQTTTIGRFETPKDTVTISVMNPLVKEDDETVSLDGSSVVSGVFELCDEDDETSVCAECCDFVPKDYLTWGEGWDKRTLTRPIDRIGILKQGIEHGVL